jgi:hypothetical protein
MIQETSDLSDLIAKKGDQIVAVPVRNFEIKADLACHHMLRGRQQLVFDKVMRPIGERDVHQHFGNAYRSRQFFRISA